MERGRLAQGVVVGLVAFACLHGRPQPAPAQPRPAAARAAVQRALPFLARDGAAWMTGGPKIPGGGKCVSCHHVGFALWSHREAERAGWVAPAAAIAALERRGHAHFVDRPSKAEPVAWSQMLLGRDLRARGPEDAGRRRTAEESLLAQQEADGQWRAGGQFPDQNRPEWESDAVATMWTLLALATFDDLGGPIRAARDRAWKWVRAARPGEGNEWLVTRLLVELRLGEAKQAHTLRDQLIGQQREDGGWSWRPGDPSNAYSTGESLYALAVAGVAADAPAIRRGVDYLLGTQAKDGAWTMSANLTSKQGGKKADYIYSYWGTGWATIGLARSQGARAPLDVAAQEAAAGAGR